MLSQLFTPSELNTESSTKRLVQLTCQILFDVTTADDRIGMWKEMLHGLPHPSSLVVGAHSQRTKVADHKPT